MTILDLLYPGDGWPAGLFCVIWTLPNRHSYWCPDKEDANKVAARLCAEPDLEVFFHAGLAPASASGQPWTVRPRIEEICYLPALWADMDDEAAVAAGPAPSWPKPDIIVNSGKGQHWYWLMSEPLRSNEAIQRRVAGWFEFLRERGVPFDKGTKDVSRVLRWPGSMNRKHGEPRPVELVVPSTAPTG